MKRYISTAKYLNKKNNADELEQYAQQISQSIYDDPELMHITYIERGIGYPNIRVLSDSIQCRFVHVEHEKYAIDSIYNTRMTKYDLNYLQQWIEDILEEYPSLEVFKPLSPWYPGNSVGATVSFRVKANIS